jgi:asparagine synthase (glutamine-hydrolysing)
LWSSSGGLQTKAILRDTVRPYLPPAALTRRKQGFSVPLREWLRTGLSEMVRDYLVGPDARLPGGLFDGREVTTLIAEHQSGLADHSPAIWLLLNYAAWHDLYVRDTAAPISATVA